MDVQFDMIYKYVKMLQEIVCVTGTNGGVSHS